MSGSQKPVIASDSPDLLGQAARMRKGASPDGLLQAMLSLLTNRGGTLLPAEELQFVPLIEDIAARADIVVRKRLAEQIAALPQAPRGLYEFIARDDIEVARPLLVECEALDDDFLIEIIEEDRPEHAEAIASRGSLSPHVSAAIVGTGAEDTIIILLENPGAEIAPKTFAEIANDHGQKPRLQNAMIACDDLPAVVAHRLFWNAASAIRRQILERFSIDEGQIDDLIAEAVGQGIADPMALEIREGLRHMTSSTTVGLRLSISDIVSFIKADEIDEFVKGVSIRLGIRPQSVRKILCDQGGEALAVLCRALYADRSQFTSVLLKNDYQRFGLPRPMGQIEQVSKIYDRIEPERALATVRVWDAIDPAVAA